MSHSDGVCLVRSQACFASRLAFTSFCSNACSDSALLASFVARSRSACSCEIVAAAFSADKVCSFFSTRAACSSSAILTRALDNLSEISATFVRNSTCWTTWASAWSSSCSMAWERLATCCTSFLIVVLSCVGNRKDEGGRAHTSRGKSAMPFVHHTFTRS